MKLKRAESGIDVRITITVRSIQNEMMADELKAMLDNVCSERYDFIHMYVDIARSNDAGFTFVNSSRLNTCSIPSTLTVARNASSAIELDRIVRLTGCEVSISDARPLVLHSNYFFMVCSL